MTENRPGRIERLIDANLNRLKEGLRVLEDISRYLFDDREKSRQLKMLRHTIRLAYDPERLYYRDTENDVLKESSESEMSRNGIRDLLIANFSRAQESARVLEEVFKLSETSLSEKFKKIRYQLYALEKDFLGSSIAKNSSNSR
jgi:thiamine-phosphate pyrophosphorylase